MFRLTKAIVIYYTFTRFTTAGTTEELRDFVYDSRFDDKLCETTDVVFEVSTPSLLLCAMECVKNASCVGFTYSTANSSCAGCRTEYSPSISLSAAIATKYFKVEWLKFVDHAYKVSTNGMIFGEVEDYCKALGGYPARVDSDEKAAFFRDLAWGYSAVWVGITDEAEEGVWRWVRGNDVTDFTDWAPDEPGNSASVNCVIIRKGSGYRWRDRPCSTEYYALCEK